MKKIFFSLKNAAPNKFLEDVLFLNKSVTYSKLRLLDKEKQERKFSFLRFFFLKIRKSQKERSTFLLTQFKTRSDEIFISFSIVSFLFKFSPPTTTFQCHKKWNNLSSY